MIRKLTQDFLSSLSIELNLAMNWNNSIGYGERDFFEESLNIYLFIPTDTESINIAENFS